jgi:3-phosphoshikimate 1-carboxyvinyltransferase
MGRVITPLEQMGAAFASQPGGRMPLTVKGLAQPAPITYALPVASAQVKSAILLAGLSAKGVTTVIETVPTRDHTERMLSQFGAKITIEKTPDGAEAISVTGPAQLKGQDITVPADISSAAFPMVAALIRPGSEMTLNNVGLNPRRAGLIFSLQEMGADIALANAREACGEPVADLTVKAGALKGVTVPADRAPSMIDEYPIFAMAAACAEGATRMCGLGELRVKESDRLALVFEGLKACGAIVEIEDDDLIVHGNGKPPRGGATIATSMDHRIAMSFLILGMATPDPVTIDDSRMIATSFPGFVAMMNGLGGSIA